MSKFKGDDFQFPDEVEDKVEAVEDELQVDIEDDTPPEDRGRKPMTAPPEDPTDDELASYDEKVQARIKKFTRGYHDERRAKEEALRERLAAEEYARKILEENKRLQKQLAEGSQVYIEQSKTTAELQLAEAKKRYKDAYEAGDADLMAEAQAELTKAALRLDKVQGMQPLQIEESVVQQTTGTNAPQMSSRDQQWLEKNTWFGPDPEMTASALGLHQKLERQNGANFVGSEEYYKIVDATMRKRFPEYFGSKEEPVQEETPRRATKPSTVVAPATRSTPPNRIKLKASEAAIARRLGVPLEQYAKQVALLNRSE
jgi:hypothetical protein